MGERKIKTRSKILAYQRELCCKKQGMTFRVSSKQDHRQLGRGHSCTPYFGYRRKSKTWISCWDCQAQKERFRDHPPMGFLLSPTVVQIDV